jgi:tetratricopeptide (TPR) repeat protein
MRPLTLILAAGLAALPFAGAARAASDADLEQARKHAAQAKVHYDLGEFAKAAEEYILVYRVRPLPALLFNIAQSYRQAGEYDKARQFYESYLRESPEGETSAQVRKALREIDELQAKEKLAKAIPPTGVKQPPDASLPLKPDPPPKAEVPPRAAAAAVPPKALPVAAAIPNVAATPDAPSPSKGPGTRTAAWITGGAAVALLGGGALFTAKAASTDSALNGGGHTRAQADDLMSQSSSQHKAGAVLLGTGLAAAGACAVLLLLP